MMKTIFAASLALAAVSGTAQDLPDGPAAHPAARRGALSRLLTVDHSLIASDGAWRVLDAYTSIKAFSNPCRCMHELDPIAPGSGKVLPTAAFQAGAFLVTVAGYQALKHTGHPRLARALLALDNASEGYAVVNNFRALGNVRPVQSSMHGLIPAVENSSK